jgi:hypothetical protein
MPTTFCVPQIEVEVDDAGLAPLTRELGELSTTRFGEPASKLAQRITLDDRIDVAAIPPEQFWSLLRALDHTRNAGTSTPRTRRLRDALVAGGITYELRFADDTTATFFSYSGMYDAGDRLVAASDPAFTVSDVVIREGEATELIVL